MVRSQPWWRRALRLFKAQWIATALILPICLSYCESRQAQQTAREALAKAYDIDRITKVQESGRVLDLALAHYFQSLSDLALVEHGLEPFDAADGLDLSKARSDLIAARKRAREAIMVHASDVQGLRGVINQEESRQYFAALSDINYVIDNGNVLSTGRNIEALSNLVKSRNSMLDNAVKSIGG